MKSILPGSRHNVGESSYDFDFALVKTTPIGRRASGLERVDLQFRGDEGSSLWTLRGALTCWRESKDSAGYCSDFLI